jgi:hypothetical protein
MTDPIQNRTSPLSFDPPPYVPTGPLTPIGAGAKVGQGGLDASVASIIDTPTPPATDAIANAYSSFVKAQTVPVAAYTVDPKTTAIQAKLDGFMQQMTPTYRLPDGSSVAVSAFFRMGGAGRQSPKVGDNLSVRKAVATKLGLKSYFDAGRPEVADIAKITQGLIDAGKLGPVVGDEALAVRKMAWDFGVGIDCAGYVQRALYASQSGTRERYGLRDVANEDLMSLSSNPKWTNVGVAAARPGDVLTLAERRKDDGTFVDVGHAMIVYEHELASPAQRESMRTNMSQDPRVQAVLSDPRLHVLKLDSSWGTGDDAQNGAGVQRRTWLYGETTGSWVCQVTDGSFWAYGQKPAAHSLGGVFRPKVQQ